MVLIQGDLAPSCSEIFGNFRDIFGCHNWAEGVLFLAFGGEKPEMLLNIYPIIHKKPTQQKIL